MTEVIRQGSDSHAGHLSGTPNPFHRTSYASGSSNVITNGKPTVRGKSVDSTACGDPAVGASPNVIINGTGVHRRGDGTGGHGSWEANSAYGPGSPNVIANESPGAPVPILPTIAFFPIFGNPAYRDSAVSYPENIQTGLTETTSPTEQIDDGDEEALICADDTDFVNPYDIAAQAAAVGPDQWKETGSNPLITELWDEIGYNGSAYADQTAWCAVFVGAILKRSGLEYKKTASSRAYSSYGTEVYGQDPADLIDLRQGDMVVFYRNGIGSGLGHIGFATGGYSSDTIRILGGNQGDTLKVSNFRRYNPAKGWGIATIRRAISCEDGTTPAPEPGPGSSTIIPDDDTVL